MSPIDKKRRSNLFPLSMFFFMFFSFKPLDIIYLHLFKILLFTFTTMFKIKEQIWASPCQSNLFLNSRLHLLVALVPPVVMAEEQEVNQHSIISHPAPGGSGSSCATTPLLFGTPASLGTPLIATPCSISVGYRQCAVFVPGCFCDTASKSQWVPVAVNIQLVRKWGKRKIQRIKKYII